MSKRIKGFSKLSKEAKMEWLVQSYFNGDGSKIEELKDYWHKDPKRQSLHDEFIENSLSNFFIPYGVAPNFVINGKDYCIPFAIEESSVVAASAKAAAFWSERGGFKSEVLSMRKIGHVHFTWAIDPQKVRTFFYDIKQELFKGTEDLNRWMVATGWVVAYRKYSLDYVADEERAKRAKLGIWSGSFEMPWDWRARGAKH